MKAGIGPAIIEKKVNTNKENQKTNENSFIPINGVEIEPNDSEMYIQLIIIKTTMSMFTKINRTVIFGFVSEEVTLISIAFKYI